MSCLVYWLINSFNAVAPEKITFQEMYMHNADGDMETLLDMFHPEGDEREVGESFAISTLTYVVA